MKSLYIFIFVLNFVAATRSFFKRCDVNGDGSLTLAEFERCFLFADGSISKSEEVVRSDIEGLFKAVDTNKDGRISTEEYSVLQQQLTKQRAMAKTAKEMQYAEEEEENLYSDNRKSINDEMIVKTKDGKVKHMKKEEFFQSYQNLQQPLDGFHRTKNNQLLREFEKTANINDVRGKDPAVARAMQIGQWSVLFMQHFQIVSPTCKMIRMSSIPVTKSGIRLSNEDLEHRRDELDYEALRIDIGNKKYFSGIFRLYLNCQEYFRVLEVQIEFNPTKYSRNPHLGMLAAYELNLSDPNDPDSNISSEVLLRLPDQSIVEVSTIDGIPFIEFHSHPSPSAEATRPSQKFKFVHIVGYKISLNFIVYVCITIVCFVVGWMFLQKHIFKPTE